MTIPIPFLNFFKKVKDQALAGKNPVPTRKVAQPVEKPSSERFSKTVMPNATRSLPPQDPFAAAARSSGSATMAPGPSRTVAFGATPPPQRPIDLPPAVALALEPMVERVVTLDLADIAAHIPADYIKPIESIDGTRRILLKASEVEKGMAYKRPTISLATVYEQVPEIFLRSIAPSDQTQVHLPFTKVLEQFASLQVRSDQERHLAVPQVETPFLKVTLEDNSRFGTATEPVEVGGGSDLPPVRIQPATAEALAAAEPELAGGFVRRGTENVSAPPKPTRISIEISPNGTGGSASESVPASSEPSVPTSSLTPPAPPTRIPFKLTAAADKLPSQHDPCSTPQTKPGATPSVDALPTPAGQRAIPTVDDTGAKISLALKPILRGVPPSQFEGDASSIPAEKQIDLPFSLIEPQLATGKIMINPEVFAARLPEEYQSLFKSADSTEILLPLQEVLKNLPTSSLRMRTDQEQEEAGPTIVTPFSSKAEEDAKRFNVAQSIATESSARSETSIDKADTQRPADIKTDESTAEVAKTKAAQTPVSATEASVAAAVKVEKPAAADSKAAEPAGRSPLQELFETDAILDDKAIVKLINKLPGVKGCALMFGDGLSLAGGLPPEHKADGLCAMAPSLIQRIEKHIAETNLGALRGMTLSALKDSITFLMHGNLCLAALHDHAELTPEVQDKLSKVLHELSQKYSSPV